MSKFRILWIDDQKTKCKKDVKMVKRILESLEYEANIEVIDDISKESLNEETGTLHKAIQARDVDLFVIDYNLKNDIFGEDVVEKIRWNNDIYTDIVFYSSEPTSLINAVKNSFDSESCMEYFDGVYIAPLGDEFTEKIKSVIQKIIKSWYNAHSIRGIVLSKASKFEQMVSDIVIENYTPCLEKLKTDINNKGENVCRTVTEKWNSVKKSNDPVQTIINDPISFNWKVKEMILRILCDEGVISINVWEDIEYIFKLRNDFAHNPIHLVDGCLVLSIKDKKHVYNEDDIERIRKSLNRIENDLQNVLL